MAIGGVLKNVRRRHLVDVDGLPVKIYVEELPMAELKKFQEGATVDDAEKRGYALLAEIVLIVDSEGKEYRVDKDNVEAELQNLGLSVVRAIQEKFQRVTHGDVRKAEENFS